ncbi:MAG: Bcr/CflA family efflux MFS transporter [Bacteroidaceae bacterium]|nr:Bcr/CflA family efflux MFS transporter [Bacteroidaceae bacterium]
MKQKTGIFVPLVLGLLTAFGPFITDFYLPLVPEMQTYFRTSSSAIAMSLTAGMIGLAIGQVFIGPLSDKYGRKKLLIASMVLFTLASVGCMIAPDIITFNTMRLLQGLGGAGGVVLSKSISTDMFTGRDLAKFMGILGAINGVTPVVAPIVGGTMTNFTSWRGVFGVLLALGVFLTICCMFLKETLSPSARSQKNILKTYGNLFKVFHNKRFTLSTTAMMFTFFAFFAFISGSPFVFQNVYGLSPFEFSLCFGLSSLMIGVGAALSTRFHHANTALKWGAIDMMISAILIALCSIFKLPLAVLMPCYIYMLTSFGLMQPMATAIALDSERENAGAASAIFGAAGFVAGAIASPLIAIGDIMISTSLVILVGSVGCLVLTLPLCKAIKDEGLRQ